MQVDIAMVVTGLTGVIILIKLIMIDRKAGRADGQREEIINAIRARIDNHDVRLNNHSDRLNTLEKTRFLTHNEHQVESDKCRKEVDRRLDLNEDTLGKLYVSISNIEKAIANINGKMSRSRDKDEQN